MPRFICKTGEQNEFQNDKLYVLSTVQGTGRAKFFVVEETETFLPTF